jgi:hypothetical protein
MCGSLYAARMEISAVAAVYGWMICASRGAPCGWVGRLGAVGAARAVFGVSCQAGQEVLPSVCH